MKLDNFPSVGLSATWTEDPTSKHGRIPGTQTAAAPSGPSDMVNLSGEKQIMARAADIGLIASQDRLNELAALVSRGAYSPDAAVVSEALIREAVAGT
jgi:hypothetical protein